MASLTKSMLAKAYAQCMATLPQAASRDRHLVEFIKLLPQADSTNTLDHFVRRLLKKYPETEKRLRQLAQQLDAKGRQSEAATVFAALGVTPSAETAPAASAATAKPVPPTPAPSGPSAAAFRQQNQAALNRRDWAGMLNILDRWEQNDTATAETTRLRAYALFELARFDDALAAAQHLLTFEAPSPALYTQIGRVCQNADKMSDSVAYLEKALTLDPDYPDALFGMSTAMIAMGDVDGALTHGKRAIAVEPGHALAYVALSTLRKGRFTEDEVKRVEPLRTARGLPADQAASLTMALGEHFRNAGDYEKAFALYTEGNSAQARISTAEGFVHNHDKGQQSFAHTKELFAAPLPARQGSTMGAEPIFIVGMPRSGTTLLESILAQHTDVTAVGEPMAMAPVWQAFLKAAQDHDDPAQLFEQHADQWADDYVTALPAQPDTRFLVDKQPVNYHSLGLMAALFPRGRILHIRRSPVETCFSIFRHTFSKQWAFAHDLRAIGQVYAVYAKMMVFWANALPEGVLLTLRHEDLIDDIDGSARRVIAHCGLDWQDACAAPHTSSRYIRTPSAVQVREPVSKAYLGSATPFREHLGPLIAALEEEGIDPDTGDINA